MSFRKGKIINVGCFRQQMRSSIWGCRMGCQWAHCRHLRRACHWHHRRHPRCRRALNLLVRHRRVPHRRRHHRHWVADCVSRRRRKRRLASPTLPRQQRVAKLPAKMCQCQPQTLTQHCRGQDFLKEQRRRVRRVCEWLPICLLAGLTACLPVFDCLPACVCMPVCLSLPSKPPPACQYVCLLV